MISFQSLARNYTRFAVASVSIFLTATTFLGPTNVFAQSIRCEDLFNTLPLKPFQLPSYHPYSGLDKNLLAQANLRLEGTKLYGLNNGTPVLIGEIKTLDAKYLFQWAEKETHDLLKNVGMNSVWMDFILNGPGQTSGKGFYVSTDPTDSANYANGYDAGLTIFKTNRPLVVLEFERNLTANFKSDSNLVFAMKSIGIDAIRMFGYSSTWLSMIHESQLQQQVPFPAEVFHFVQNGQPKYYSNFIKYVQATANQKNSILKTISPNDTFKKLLTNKKLDWNDIHNLAKSENALSRYDKKVQDHFIDQGLKLIKTAETAEQLVDLLHAFDSLHVGNLDWIAERKPKMQTATKRKYQALLEIFDAATVANLASLSSEQAVQQFNSMKANAQSYAVKRAGINFKKIKTAQQLIKTAEKLFDTKFEYRKQFSYMSNDLQPIEVSNYAYQVLRRNRLLNVTLLEQRPKIPGNVVLAVRYWTPHELDTNFYGPQVALQPFKETANRLRADLEKGSNFDNSLPDFFKELVESIFSKQIVYALTGMASNPSYFQSPEQLYHLFMSFHPMTDGNGRLGRFLYEYLTAEQSDFQNSRFLNLISYDLDLTVNPVHLGNQIVIGTLLNEWILEAKNDAEFVQRCYWAVKVFRQAYPDLKHNF